MTTLDAIYSPSEFRKQGHDLINLLADYLENAQSATPEKTIPFIAPEDNLAFWQADLAKGVESDPLDFFRKVVEKSTKLHNPRYIGHQVSTVAPLSALSQVVMGMMNNGGAVYEMGMVTNSLERVVTDWLSRHFGFRVSDFGESLQNLNTHELISDLGGNPPKSDIPNPKYTEGGGIITSGGTLANLTALLAARAWSTRTTECYSVAQDVSCTTECYSVAQDVSRTTEYHSVAQDVSRTTEYHSVAQDVSRTTEYHSVAQDVWTNGTTENLALMVSEEAHYCVDRAARIMGWGTEGIIKVPTNDQFQMKTELLDAYFEKAEAEGRRVIAVVGSACSTSTGSYDDLEAIADFAERRKIWFHVDGAHGGAAILSKKYKHLLRGSERADSIIVDFHKMMMVPSLATAVLFRNPAHSYRTFHQKAQYLWENFESQDWFNLGKRTFECTKPMLAVKVYVLLKTYGEAAFEEFIDRTHGLATDFAKLLRGSKNFKIGVEPQSNIVCFRFLGTKSSSRSKKKELSVETLNQLNTSIRLKLVERGDFYIVQTIIRGEVYLRVSIMNPLTTIEHLKELLSDIEEVGYNAIDRSKNDPLSILC
jgi:glutamate/tyrosine decarboxylase-like PLP-dependent enzyme